MKLSELGWNKNFEGSFNEQKTGNCFPARVVTAQREIYSVISESGEFRAELSGKFRYRSESMGELPVVGDWVIARLSPDGNLAIVEGILPRKSKFSRKTVGKKTDEQVLIANIDRVFLVNGLDGDFNPRRIERYLTLVWDSNVSLVIILNKTDVCDNVEQKVVEVESIARGVPVYPMSALKGSGFEPLKKYINPGSTIAFLGSSGVGKSTIINYLLGEERQKTGSVREWDSQGRHVTTSRELFVLPESGILIDNPGLRELQMWADEDDVDETFTDIKAIAMGCKFKDCQHNGEPGCAVKLAIENNELDEKRYENYIKLKKELKYLAMRKDTKSRRTNERKFSKIVKQFNKLKNKKIK